MQFRTCIGTLGITLTAQEVNDLIKKYSAGAGLVNYKDFVSKINHVFTEHANSSQVIHGAKSQAVSPI